MESVREIEMNVQAIELRISDLHSEIAFCNKELDRLKEELKIELRKGELNG